MRTSLCCAVTCSLLCLAHHVAGAQATVTVRVDVPAGKSNLKTVPTAVFWLEPVEADVRTVTWPAQPPYRLLQKNRTFSPHVLVVPVGASVAFPNADTYFHNVFSLFEGSRFDLGLYEAGTTRNVRFTRKGVSYIFCNIHPEMGAVVLSLDTPLWTASATPTLTLAGVPTGTYQANMWVEGQDASKLVRWRHVITVPNAGTLRVEPFVGTVQSGAEHMDKFGQPYKRDVPSY